MQHIVSDSVKDISFESFLSDLLFIGIYCELQRDGLWVEGKETAVRYNGGWDGEFNKKRALSFAVLHNLFNRVCVRIVKFCANCISNSYSAIQTVYLDNTNQQFTALKPSTVLRQGDTFHRHLKTVEHIY